MPHSTRFQSALVLLTVVLASCGQQLPPQTGGTQPAVNQAQPVKASGLQRVLDVHDARPGTAFSKVVAGAGGAIYVAGALGADPSANAFGAAFVSKYTPAGALVWTKTFGDAKSQSVSGLVLGADGNIYVNVFTWRPDNSFSTSLTRLSPKGEVLLTKAVPEVYGDYLVDAGGQLFVPTGSNTTLPQVQIYDASFNLSRTLSLGSGRHGLARFLKQDRQGNVFVSGYYQEYIPEQGWRHEFPDCPSESFVARLGVGAADGPLWFRTFKDESLPRSEVNDLSVDAEGRLFMVWNAFGIDCNDDLQSTSLKRYDTDGTWRYNVHIPRTFTSDVKIAGSVGGTVYVVDGVYVDSVFKYSSQDGHQLATEQLDLPATVRLFGSQAYVSRAGGLYLVAQDGDHGYLARFEER